MIPSTACCMSSAKPSASPSTLPWLSMRHTSSPRLRAVFSTAWASSGKNGLVRSGSTRPIARVRPVRIAWAARFGRYASCLATRSTFCRLTRPTLGRSLRTLETVATDTPTAAAMSFTVAMCHACAGFQATRSARRGKSCAARAGARSGPRHDPFTASAEASSSETVQEVIVTATRREERLLDVPVSASALSGAALEVLGSAGQDIRQLAFAVPSLNIESSNGRTFPRFYIRGYDNGDFHNFASQPVGLYYDDI